MDVIFDTFRKAIETKSGYLLASTITPDSPADKPTQLYDFVRSSTSQSIQTDIRYATVYDKSLSLTKPESQAWQDIFVAFWKAAAELVISPGQTRSPEGQWSVVYDAWKEVVNALIRGYNSSALAAWTVPCLYVAGRYLRSFAILADDQNAASQGSVAFNGGFQDDVVDAVGKHDKLEDAARQINRIFSLCISDRAPLEESRKWAVYYTTNLLFKTYFKLNAISLSKNILHSLQATTTDLPDLKAFPKSHIVTFKYYVGVILFLEEDYAKAEDNLTEAWRLCHRNAHKNRELILTYLIPCHLLTTHTLPSKHLLEPYPNLQDLFGPLGTCMKRGDLAGFEAALAAGQGEFVKRRIYLTLERGKDIALRNLFRKVFLAGGFEESKDGVKTRRSRVPVEEFVAAMRLGLGQTGEEGADRDEVECLIANMIYKNLMKGYISREHAKVVLSRKGDAFPGTGV